MKGFGQYVRRPLGFFVTLYATLITLFGLAWVLFLIGWIYVGDRNYTLSISSTRVSWHYLAWLATAWLPFVLLIPIIFGT